MQQRVGDHSFSVVGGKMKEKLQALVGTKFDSLGIVIDDVYIGKEGNETTLYVVLDREEMLDLKTVVQATRILNPIVDEADLVDGSYTLDVYAKEKGDVEE